MTRPEEHQEEAPDSQPSGVRDSLGATDCQTLVVVGHGMVGQRLIEEIRRRSELNGVRIVAVGKETTSAYDRVHLADVVRVGDAGLRSLADPSWFDENKVELVIGDPVEEIDRDAAVVVTRKGQRVRYDHLILATGSRPNFVKIPGLEGERVRPLRSLEDALEIRRLALSARERSLPVVVIGAGLLGIELADELVGLGVEVEVLESADYPLCRQLEPDSGARLERLLRRRQFSLSLKARVERAEDLGDRVLVHLEGRAPIVCGVVVPAVGVRARDELARKAGLGCDLFGGIQVTDDLLTSDPKISAIGECARHRGMTYGLVAPGYAMAVVVAERLAGKKARFQSAQMGTRLKLSDVQVTCLGESSARGLGVRSLTVEKEGVYRRLVLRHRKILGVVSLGEWDELPRVQEAFARRERLKKPQIERFERALPIWKRSEISLEAWPEEATVCNCMGVSCGELRRAQKEGCRTVEGLKERTGASTVCGSCEPLLVALTLGSPAVEKGESRLLAPVSVTSLVGALLFLFLPAIPYSTSVQDLSMDAWFVDSVLKQCTGWTLFALFFASVVFSARKRLSRFRFGDFEGWRLAHASIGLLCLFAAFLHTGLRLGEGLDHALILVSLGGIFLGGASAGVAAIESRLTPSAARKARTWLVRLHIYLLWPLPVLVCVHVLKVYFF